MHLPRIYLVLHSYELAGCLWLFIYLFSLGNFWKAIAIGFTQHMIFDQLLNPVTPFGYFLTYRMVNGFKKAALIKEAGTGHGT